MSNAAQGPDPNLDHFHDLLARARAGDPNSASDLYEQYSKPIRHLIRLRLERMDFALRKSYDVDDCLNSVWFHFFESFDQHHFESPENLLAFLGRIALNRLGKARTRYLETEKRDPGRETGLSPEFPAPQAAPDEVATANDQWQAFLRPFPLRKQHALQMLRAGHTQKEVTERLPISERTIGRLVQELRAYLQSQE